MNVAVHEETRANERERDADIDNRQGKRIASGVQTKSAHAHVKELNHI